MKWRNMTRQHDMTFFDSLGHEGHVDGLPVQLGSHLGGVGNVAAVHEPEACGDGGGEANAVVDERERSRSRHVLPLRSRRAACNMTRG